MAPVAPAPAGSLQSLATSNRFGPFTRPPGTSPPASLTIQGTILAGGGSRWMPGLLPSGVYRFAYPRHGSFERFLLYVPDVAPGTPRPLMVGFHSYSRPEVEILLETTFFDEAMARDWYCLTPLGRHDIAVSQETFSSPNSQASVAEDLRRVLEDFEIDTDRIYGFGFSIGGGAVTNYAARHLDPDPTKGMFAAIANHTGSVSISHVYFNEFNDGNDPPYDVPDYLDYLFGGGPNLQPFRYSQASTIELDDQTGIVDPDNSLAWNLAHVPVQIWYRTTDPITYLLDQTLAFEDFLRNQVGASVQTRAITQGPNQHTWFTMREEGVCDYFDTRSLTLPQLAKTIADRDATYFYFDVEQRATDAFTPFSWWTDRVGNDVHFSEVANMGAVTVDLAGAQIDPLKRMRVLIQADDAAPFDLTLEGISTLPWKVRLDGADIAEVICGASGGWCLDGSGQRLSLPASLVPADTGTHVWEVWPLAPDAGLSSAGASPTQLVADGFATSTISVTIVDANGAPVPGVSVALSSDGSGDTLVQPGPTNAAGQTSGTIASIHEGTKTLTITVDPGGADLVLSAQPTVVFTGDPANVSASLSSLFATPTGDVVANGVDESVLTVTVRDVNGNRVPGVEVALASTGGGNTIGQPAGPTDALGVATATIRSTVAEAKTLSATVDPSGTPTMLTDAPIVEFIGDASAISAALSSVDATPSTGVVANDVDESVVTITLRDVNGNLVPAVDVELASSGSGDTLVQPSGPTDAFGVATATIRSTVAEGKTLTVTADPLGTPIVLGDTPSVEFIGDASAISAVLSSVGATPSTGVVANDVDESVVTITLRDVNGNLVPAVDVELASSGSGDTLVQPSGPTDAFGVATARIRSTVAEGKTLTVTADPLGTPIVLGDTPSVEFIGDASAISATLSSVDATPSTGVVANDVDESVVTITLRDVNGNLVPAVDVELASSGSGHTIGQPAGPTDALGVASATIRGTVAETKTLTATADPLGAPVVLSAAPTVEFVADPSTISASLSAAIASPALGVVADGLESSVVTVTVVDAFGNPVGGQVVEVAASGSDNMLQQPSGVTDAGGQATASLASTRAETKLLTVTIDPGGAALVLNQMPSVEFVGDPATIDPSLSTIAVTPAFGALADGVDSVAIDVVVRDQFGNPVSGQTVELAASGSAGTLTQPAASDASGLASGSLASTAAERKTIAATINPGASEVVVDPPAEARFVWSRPDTYYVRAGGSDAAAGTSPAAAWATLSHAASQLAAGDSLWVGAGTYFDTPSFTTAGASGAPIRVLADTSGARTGDAGVVRVDGGGAATTIEIDGAGEFELRGFTLTGASPGVGASGGGVTVGATTTTAAVVLAELDIYDCARGIELVDAPGAVVEDCRVTNQLGGDGQGLRIVGTTGATLRDLLVYGNAGPGLVVEGGATGVELRSSTFYSNGGAQVAADGASTVALVSDCLFVAGASDGLVATGGATLSSDYNDLYGQAGSDYVGVTAGASDQALDPALVDPDGADLLLGGANADDDAFELGTSSPALDAGSGSATAATRTSASSLADRTTLVAGTLDGSGTNGATLDLGYHSPAPSDALDTLSSGDARLVHATSGARAADARRLDGTAGSLASSLHLPPFTAGLRWLEAAASPLDGDEEWVLAWGEDGGASVLALLEWDGTAWSRAWAASSLPAAQIGRRGFDLCVTAAGEVLAVYVDGSETPRYRMRRDGVWSDEAALPLNDGVGPNPDPNSAAAQWVRLAPRPGTDEVALAYSDADADLVALVWNGTQWDTSSVTTAETTLAVDSTSGEVDARAFDLAWEGSSGDLLLAWSRQGSTGVWYASLAAGGSWGGASHGSTVAPSGAPQYVELRAEPGGDRIAIGAMRLDDTEALALAVWDGSGLVNAGELDAQARDWNGAAAGRAPLSLAWVGSGGTVLCAYADTESAALSWASWTSGAGWTLETDEVVSAMAAPLGARLVRLASGDVLWIGADDASALFGAVHDGSAWSSLASGAAVAGSVPTGAGMAWALATRD